ncbi:WD repeat-containing protein 89 [Culicoides brevitarsis]|uniref:WD repeat-containing protein 89 n=1 Tax=Culicoides brevitarsis TaxID=469753 RepID=UPI00307C66E1
MKQNEKFVQESSDEEDPVPDFDTCDENELNRLFKRLEPFEIQVGQDLKEYILHLTTTSSTKTLLATGSSTGIVQLYDVTTQKGLVTPKTISKDDVLLSGLKFDPTNDNILYVNRVSGECKSYDLRSNEVIHAYFDDSSGTKKPFSCMDVNQNGRILCCGTEKIRGDAFLLFFDTRQRQLLGGYWESHEDDITNIKFHPKNPDSVASSSTDGLLNVYDIKQSTEDDALLVSFNTESSPSQAFWYKKDNLDHLACITDTNDLQLFNVETQDKVHEFKRSEIATQLKRNSPIDCCLLGCYVEKDDVFFVGTSNFNKGECLRSLKLSQKMTLEPSYNFVRANQIFRCAEYNEKAKILFTGGEDGRVQLWNLDDSLPSDGQNLKEKSKLSEKPHKKVKPY